MAKVNVMGLVRPADVIESVTITDPANPGVEVTFNVREPRITDLMNIGVITNRFVEMYATPQKDGTYLSLPPLNGEVVATPTIETVQLACTVHQLQDHTNPDDVYTVEEILLLMEAMPNGVLPLLEKVQQLADKFGSVMENPTKTDTTSPSVVILDSLDGTPNLMHV